MFLAAKHTIGHLLLMLPYRAQFLLESQRVGKISNLLEFIKADNDSYPFL
jgi:hypothetical protein